MSVRINKQRVIIYTLKDRDYIYGTAYDEEQARDVMSNCLIRRGVDVNVRIKLAPDPSRPQGTQ